MAAVFTVLAGLFHHQCCMEFAAGQHRQSGRSFHAALMVQQACQHRSYISQCMGRLGSAYSMKRFDAASPHQGFKTSLLFALKSLAAVLITIVIFSNCQLKFFSIVPYATVITSDQHPAILRCYNNI